jgi:hypothetical protein
MPNRRGVALTIVIFLLLIVLPLILVLSKRASHHLTFSVREKQTKSSRVLAGAAMADFMRGWSEDHRMDRFSPRYLDRLDDYLFSTFGFSSVDFAVDRPRHTLFMRARGNFKTGMGHAARNLSTLVRFHSDYPRFALVARGDLSIDAPRTRVSGGIWTNGALSVTAPEVDLGESASLGEGQDYAGAPDTALAALYCSGDASNAVGAVRYRYSPLIETPKIDPAYYLVPYNHVSGDAPSTEWIFTDTDGSMRVNGVSVTYSTGAAVLVARNTSLTISGVVRGRITVAVLNGDVTVKNLSYSTGQESALAVIAERDLRFENLGGGDLSVSGLYYASMGVSFTGDPGARFTLNGTLILPETAVSLSSSGFSSLSFHRDPDLWSKYPSRLPEKPILVSWRMES